jgi:hypothetical protein
MAFVYKHKKEDFCMNKNEIKFLKERIQNFKNKLEIAQTCINSALDSLDESDDLIKIVNFHHKNIQS